MHARLPITYARANLTFLQASCAALPLATGAVDLAVTYEVIEHIAEWQAFLHELRRVLGPCRPARHFDPEQGTTTPTLAARPARIRTTCMNSISRSSPAELRALFPHVALYLQNHVEGIAFQPVEPDPRPHPQLYQQISQQPNPATAHFFLAVCS